MQPTSVKEAQDWSWLDRKAINREMSKELKFEHNAKWYRVKPESLQKNQTRDTVCDFEIQMHHRISIGRPYLAMINQKKELDM